MNEEFFGAKLRKLREERGLTIQELSMRAGIHQSTISRLETDMCRRPHVETFVQLAKGFGLSIQELAVYTELIEPKKEKSLLIEDGELLDNFRLFNRENLNLLKELDHASPETRYHLYQFITGLKKDRIGKTTP